MGRSLEALIRKKPGAPVDAEPVEAPQTSGNGLWPPLATAIDVLGRPGNAVANVLRGDLPAAGRVLIPGLARPEDKVNASDVLYGEKDPALEGWAWAGSTAGRFLTDVATDPLTWTGILAETAIGKQAAKTAALSGTLAAQGARDERALLTVGIPFTEKTATVVKGQSAMNALTRLGATKPVAAVREGASKVFQSRTARLGGTFAEKVAKKQGAVVVTVKNMLNGLKTVKGIPSEHQMANAFEKAGFWKLMLDVATPEQRDAYNGLFEIAKTLKGTLHEENLKDIGQFVPDEIVTPLRALFATARERVHNVDLIAKSPDITPQLREFFATKEGRDALEVYASTLKTFETILENRRQLDPAAAGIRRMLLNGVDQGYFPHVADPNSVVKQIVKDMGRGGKKSAIGGLGKELPRKVAGFVETSDFFKNTPDIHAMAAKAIAVGARASEFDYVDEIVRTFGRPIQAGEKLLPGEVQLNHDLFKGWAVPGDIGKELNTSLPFIVGDKTGGVENFLRRYWDPLTREWKVTSTYMWPSFSGRNFVSGVWQNITGGVTKPQDYWDGAAVLNSARTPKSASKMFYAGPTLGKLSAQELTDLAYTHGAMKIRTGTMADIAEDMLVRTHFSEGESWAQKSATWLENAPGIKKMGQFSQAIERQQQMTHFLAKLRMGYTPERAAAEVRKYLFDYADLSDIEKQLFKRIAPFYTWTRKNIPAVLRDATNYPGRYTGLAKFVDHIEAGQETLPFAELPTFIQESMPFQWRNDKGVATYLTLRGYLPPADIQEFIVDQPTVRKFIEKTPPRILRKAILMLHPALLESIEQSSGRDIFRNIELDQQSRVNMLGINMPRRVASVISNIRLATELDRVLGKDLARLDVGPFAGVKDRLMPTETETDPSVTARLLRFVTGVATRSVKTQEQHAKFIRDAKNQFTEAKRQVTMAARRGNVSEVRRLKARAIEDLNIARKIAAKTKVVPGE